MSIENPLSVFLFYGEDTYSSFEKLKLWKEKFIEKHTDTNLEIIEGKELDPANFETNLEALPFLSKKRLLIVKNFLSRGKAEELKRIAKIINKTPDFCIIVFHETSMPDKRTSLYKKIAKIGKIQEFKALSPGNLTNWILKKSQEKELKINRQAATYLGQYCGTNLWTLNSELEKLKSFAHDKEVTKEMIEKLATPSLTASIFKLTDSIANKNHKQSLKNLEKVQESGEELTRIFYMIVRHFRILIQVHEMISKKEPVHTITKRLKQHPFVIQKTSQQAHNFNLDLLETIFQKLLEIDIGIKTGKIKSYGTENKELKLAIEKLIIEFCNN